MRTCSTTLYLLLFYKSLLFAQSIPITAKDSIDPVNRMIFDRISTEDGLSTNSITAILEDTRGFMWFGTEDGLHRYNGYGCKIYRHSKKDSLSLIGNTITFLHQGEGDIIWVGTSNGLSKFNLQTEQFTNYQYDAMDSTSLADNAILSMVMDSLGQLVIGTKNQGLEVFDPKKEVFYHYPPNPKDSTQLAHTPIHQIKKDNQGNIWLGTQGGGMYYFDQKNKNIKRIGSHKDPVNWISWMNQYFDGTFEALHRGVQVKKINIDRKTWEDIPYGSNASGQGIRGKFKILEGPNLSRWTITKEKIIIENKNQKRVFSIANFPENLNWDSYISPFFDSKGDLWLSDYVSGLYRISFQGQKFTPFLPKQYLAKIAPNKLLAITEDSAKNIWFSTYGNTIYKYNPKTNALKEYLLRQKEQVNIDDLQLKTIDEIAAYDIDGYPDDEIWVSGIHSIYKYDLERDTFLSKIIKGKGEVFIATFNVYKDNTGNIWFPTRNLGFVRYTPKLNYFKVFSYEPKGYNQISFLQCFNILSDDSSSFWLGTFGGLATFNPSVDEYYRIFEPKTGQSKITGSYFTTPLLKDSKGMIWVSQEGKGLYRINPVNRSYDFFDESDGLTANYVKSVQEDKQGDFWIWSEKNLIKLNPETRVFKKYGESDGLLVSNSSDISYKNPDTGEMFFGLNSFFPEAIKDNPHPPRVSINWAEKYNNDNQGKATSLKGIAYRDKIDLKYNDNIINFEFASLNYSNPAASEYQYQLKGLSDNWINLGTKRNLTLTNLSPGQYDLNFKAANEDGLWSEARTLQINVAPPWWWNNWSKSLYVLALGSILFGLYRFQLNRQLAEAEALRLSELDAVKTKMYTNITHEFRTPLSVILGTAEQLNETESVKKETIQRNSLGLLNLVNQMLDLSKLEAGNLT